MRFSEMILDSSFNNTTFVTEGYAPPFRSDKNCHGGGILLFIMENIAVKMISPTQNYFVLQQ